MMFGLEYSAKSVSEMIKDCQLRFMSKQMRVSQTDDR